jgi:ribosomal protein S12 methylthiotransferase
MKAAILSLGCPRNLVDSEVILGSLKRRGARIVEPDASPDTLVINTCSFIASAREESVEAIITAAELKKTGRIKRLVVCGCLPQLYRDRLLDEVPEIDLIVGTSDFPKIATLLERSSGEAGTRSGVSRNPSYIYDGRLQRSSLTKPHYAYVKIAEGCDNHCSYCIISRLRGRFRSRTVNSVADEVKRLASSGKLKEIILIGQDTTSFGLDRGKPELAALLKELCRMRNSIRWIRLLYTHPAHYTDGLIKTVAGEERVCKYLDLPVQHSSDKILRAMNRRTTRGAIVRLIERLRKEIPGLVLRTSVIVGFPGETEEDFKGLLEFIREMRFERLGAFTYSREDATPAAKFARQVTGKVKRERFDAVMELQKEISTGVSKEFLGRTLDVLIDERSGEARDTWIGRTYADAPDIDGEVHASGKGIKAGDFCRVRITDTMEYDLVGETV